MAREKKIARYKSGLWLTKDNRLIRMHGNMTSLSYKLTNYFLWKCVKEGRLNNLQITTAEISNILEYKNKGMAAILDEESNKIMKTIIEVKKEGVDDEWKKITLIPYMEFKDGVVTAKINPDLMPYITGLTSNFTRTDYAMLNSCSYAAMRLAEVCSSWANAGFAYYSIDEWRALLGATSDSYKVVSQFRRRILHPAVKEVNERMNYNITPIEIKEGRKVTHIKMIIEIKPDVQSRDGEMEQTLVAMEAARSPSGGENTPAKRRGRPPKKKDKNLQAEPDAQPSLFEKPLSDIEADVVERMVSRYGYDQTKAAEAVKQHGVVYCQEQMETVRKAIKSAELAGKEIRSKGGYLNEALKKGYAQISKSLARAKEAEQEEADDKKLWNKQAREFYYGEQEETDAAPKAEVLSGPVESEDAEYQKELEKWEKMKGELRRALFAAMVEKGNLEIGEFKKAMDDFEATYPKPLPHQ